MNVWALIGLGLVIGAGLFLIIWILAAVRLAKRADEIVAEYYRRHLPDDEVPPPQ